MSFSKQPCWKKNCFLTVEYFPVSPLRVLSVWREKSLRNGARRSRAIRPIYSDQRLELCSLHCTPARAAADHYLPETRTVQTIHHQKRGYTMRRQVKTVELVLETKDDALQTGAPLDHLYHWREPEEIEAIGNALRDLGSTSFCSALLKRFAVPMERKKRTLISSSIFPWDSGPASGLRSVPRCTNCCAFPTAEPTSFPRSSARTSRSSNLFWKK